jgi:vancomycin resistance protein YoaR
MGLDATVVYPAVDLKLRNPYDFPIVIHAATDRGSLMVELFGHEKPATVEFNSATIGVANFKRKVEEAAWLPEGKIVKKQKGIRGYSIRKTRYVHLRTGEERVDTSTDVYPPTLEIYLVPRGTDVTTALPPLPSDGPTGDSDV